MLAPMSKLHFTDQGQGDACLLVHAFPFDGRMWEAQAEALARTHRVIVPDLRGFGRSLGLPPARSLDDHADDLDALLASLGIENAAVAGLSMGGYISFALWRRHPSRVRALVLADTRAVADSPETKTNREAHIELVRSKGAKALMETLRPSLLAKDAGEEAVQRALTIGGSQTAEGVADALMAMRDRPDSRPLLPTISVPVTVIVGEYDAISGVSEMKELADAIPGARFAVIPNAGHLANLESPALFNKALRGGIG